MTDRPDPGTDTIIERLGRVAADLRPIDKDEINAGGQRYKAFTIDNVYRNVGPLFSKHGIVVVPRLESVEYDTYTTGGGKAGTVARVVMQYDFVGAGGDRVTMIVPGEGRDTSDKATNKAIQQAFKYGLIQAFRIATGEVDPDALTGDEHGVDYTNWTKAVAIALHPDDPATAWGTAASNVRAPSFVTGDIAVAIVDELIHYTNDVAPTRAPNDTTDTDTTEDETDGK